MIQMPPENMKRADVTIDLDRCIDGEVGLNGEVDDGGGVLMDLDEQVTF